MEVVLLNLENTADNIRRQISELYKQLSPHKNPLPLTDIMQEDNAISLVYCLEGEKVLGIASMCTYRILSGYKGWIEDVVVSEETRGKGIGRKLMQKLIAIGKEKQLSTILLFTEAHRKAAIHLYTDLGFQPRDSQIYQLRFPKA